MTSSKNYKQVLAHFNGKSQDIIRYFPEFKKLVVGYSWDVSVSYVFSRIETAKHMAIYCGIVKLHWADSALTKGLVDKDHMSRSRFRELFKTVYGNSMDAVLLDKLSSAEAIRDKVVHGKIWADKQARSALIDILDFAEGLNELTYKIAGFNILGDLRGFKGRKESLSRDTTRWVLRGMGIPAKE